MLKRILAIISTAVAAVFLLAPAVALAQNQSNICEGINFTSGSQVDCNNQAAANATASKQISGLIKTIINVFSVVIGAVSVIMIMIGGFKYITSTGDSNSVNSAKNTILYAIVGLVIVGLAQVIVAFVLSNTSKATTPQTTYQPATNIVGVA